MRLDRLTHEAFVYHSDAEFVRTIEPFLRDGLRAGHATVVVSLPSRIELLRAALGEDAAAVSFVDADDWYRRPGATLAGWRRMFDEHDASGTEFVRAVGEVRFGDQDRSNRSWTRYESLFNRAFRDRRAWVICPYDARALPDSVLDECRLTHPVVTTVDGRKPSPDHFTAGEIGAVLAPAEEREVEELARVSIEDPGDLVSIRRAVVWPARALGLAPDLREDLVLAATELTREALGSRGGPVTLRAARADGEWFCEVASGTTFDLDGLGLAIARVVCDRVDVVDDGRSVVRLVFGIERPKPRERILAAADELFAQTGVRDTGVNAIAAKAGVAKATFYANFPSKDELVLAWARRATSEWLETIRLEAEASAASPVDRLTGFFGAIGDWIAADPANGALWLSLRKEADRNPSVDAELTRTRAATGSYFRDAAAEAGLADPDTVVRVLHLLVRGVLDEAAGGSADPARLAARVAERLVASSQDDG